MKHVKVFGVVLVLLLVGLVWVAPAAAQEQGRGRGRGEGRGRGRGNMPAGVQATKLADGSMALADAKGMTLYTFAKDQPGVSNCNDNCAKNWPPLMAAADATPQGDWTIVTRADGTKMWAYKGMPVYLWIKDAKPGDNTGNGVGNGAWKTAVP
jgi:predicted lipoprotein with Yx(FWY)xxD motif